MNDYSANSPLYCFQKLSIDCIAAGASSFSVSPFIMIFDRSIIESAAGKRRLSVALRDILWNTIRNPHQIIRKREFWLLYTVYFSTYASANVMDTIGELSERNTQLPKFFTTTVANMTTSIYKDREFARMYGVVTPTKLPLISYLLFAGRDMITIGGSFNLPQYISKQCETKLQMDSKKAHTIAQLACPALLQFVTCPFHLLALDFYNNKKAKVSERASFLSRQYWGTTFTRIGRILPAFGIGGIGNNFVKARLTGQLNQSLQVIGE